MRDRILLSCITLFALVVTVSAQTQGTVPIPRLEKRGAGASLRLIANPGILRVSLYSYR